MTVGKLDPFWGAHFLQAYSTGGLHLLHQAVQEEVAKNPNNVAEHPDFKAWALLIEAELSSRNETFVVITFP